MWEDLIVDEARRRAEIFRNLEKYLRIIAETVRELDREAKVYLFGSVAEGRSLLSSDIDILVVTDKPPGEVLAALWERGIRDLFEIHVATKQMLESYRRRVNLIEIS